MNNKLFSIIAVSALSLTASYAKTHPVSSQVRESLQDVEFTARQISVQSENLGQMSKNSIRLTASPMQEMVSVRDEINRIGKQLRVIDNERASLPAWEQRSLDEITPLLANAARNQNLAIEYFNANSRAWPLSSEFRGYVEHVRSDSDRVAKLLNEHLKLAKAKDTEHRLEQVLGEPEN